MCPLSSVEPSLLECAPDLGGAVDMPDSCLGASVLELWLAGVVCVKLSGVFTGMAATHVPDVRF